MNILRTSLALVAVAFVAVPFAGCAVDTDSKPEQAPVAETRQAIVQDLTTVAAIEADPAFQAFYPLFRDTAAPFLGKGMTMTKQARDQFLAGLQGLTCSAPNCPELTQYLAGYNMQIDLNKLGQVMTLDQQLRDRGATQDNLVHAMIDFQGIEYRLNPVDGSQDNPNPDYDGCLGDCEAGFAYAAVAALYGYIGELAVCTAMGPGWPVCVAVATAQYAYELYEANQALIACEDRCNSACSSDAGTCGPSSSTLNQSCLYDTDCASAEHCNTLVQGLPGHCKSDFHDGHVCTRNAWCTSNHCVWFLCVP